MNIFRAFFFFFDDRYFLSFNSYSGHVCDRKFFDVDTFATIAVHRILNRKKNSTTSDLHGSLFFCSFDITRRTQHTTGTRLIGHKRSDITCSYHESKRFRTSDTRVINECVAHIIRCGKVKSRLRF